MLCRRLPRGVAQPTDDGVAYALLDLSGEVPSVAESKLRTIFPRIAGRLFLQGELRLIVASGRLEPKAAASVIADALDAEIPSDLTLGVVRGESLLDRLEELTLAGCSLERPDAEGRLLDEPIPPAAVWAATGAGPIVEALAAGASIVVTQAADIGTMAIAAAAETFAWPATSLEKYASAAATTRFALLHLHEKADAVLSDDRDYIPSKDIPSKDGAYDFDEESITLPDLSYTATFQQNKNDVTTILSDVEPPGETRRVIATMPVGAALQTLISLPGSEGDPENDAFRKRLQKMIPPAVVLAIEQVGNSGSFLLRVQGKHMADVVDVAENLELQFDWMWGSHILRRPLLRDITPCFGPWVTEVPLELLQYGVDVRRTTDWLD